MYVAYCYFTWLEMTPLGRHGDCLLFLNAFGPHLYSYLSYNAVCVEFSRGIKTAVRRFKAAIHQRGEGGHVKVCDIHTGRYRI